MDFDFKSMIYIANDSKGELEAVVEKIKEEFSDIEVEQGIEEFKSAGIKRFDVSLTSENHSLEELERFCNDLVE